VSESLYVLPTAAYPAPLEGLALHNALQAWVVGVTGLSGDLVRPAWPSDLPNVPTAGTCWASLRVNRRDGGFDPYVAHNASGQTVLQRFEALELLVSFYDLGFNGQADAAAALLRDGIFIEQNRYPLRAAGLDVTSAGEITPAPTLLKERWQYRADLTITLTREIDRAYAVPDVAVLDGTLTGADPAGDVLTVPLTTTPPA